MATLRSLLLENRNAPGDVLVMTSAVRALHTAYPGEYQTFVASFCPDIWKHNPLVTVGTPPAGTLHLNLSYTRGINNANLTKTHFSSGFTLDLATKLRRNLRVSDIRPHVVLTDNEGPVHGLEPYSYWVVMAGGKQDFTAKLWGSRRWQALVDLLPGIKWVQAGHLGPTSIQKSLKNVVNLLGKTNFRQFLRLIAYSRGVVCPVTCGMHAAAAFNRPCVVVAGGREPWWWEAYTKASWRENCGTTPPSDFVPHAYLHTIGRLPCCDTGGCWKSHVDARKGHSCVDLVRKAVGRVPHCLDMITPERVAEAVLGYERGELPPEDPIPEHLGPVLRYTENPVLDSKPTGGIQ